ncbi:hypothetical protein Cni_G29068 [Canna indica]|uniref:Amino acid transporter transmembrane domain-containing protein n=1 Tax=Canna indica TaxID=4628 RepID=A0AAQ3QQW9_9LILI|nr:hypothetical protein Cni_G29068 [Canna indica]
MDSNPQARTYPDIGEIAFGRWGRLLVSVFLYLELYLVATEFLILEGDNMEKLFPREDDFDVAGIRVGGKQGYILVGALVILPTTWLRSLDVLSLVSLGGVLASIGVVVSVLWGGFTGVGFREKGVLINWSGIPTAVSLFGFCYAGHSVFPTIYTGMKDKKRFSMEKEVN